MNDTIYQMVTIWADGEVVKDNCFSDSVESAEAMVNHRNENWNKVAGVSFGFVKLEGK